MEEKKSITATNTDEIVEMPIDHTLTDEEVQQTQDMIMTHEQIDKVYESLEQEKNSITKTMDNVISASNIIDDRSETEILQDAMASIDSDVSEGADDYHKALEMYGLTSDKAITDMLNAINKLKNNEKYNYYDALPKELKQLADYTRLQMYSQKLSKNTAAKIVLYQVIKDAQFNKAIDEFQESMNEEVANLNREYNKIFLESFEDAFSKIDTLAVENPEQAEKLSKVKHSFDLAKNMEKVKQYIQSTNPNKLRKWTNRYKDEVDYFNKLVNVTDVKIPDISELVPIISVILPEYDLDVVKKFVVAICRHAYNLNVKDNVEDLAYIYRLVNNIYSYKFLDDFDAIKDEEATTLLFGNIASVLDCIK